MRLNMSPTAPSAETAVLSGAVLVLIQFDVCEELRLDRLRDVRGGAVQQKPSMKNAAPAYVRYERPPVVEPLEPIQLESGENLSGEIKYYDYGVVSVVFQLPFAGDWNNLVHLASRWVWDVDFASRAEPVVKQRLAHCSDAMIRPYTRWLSEDYFIFHVSDSTDKRSAKDLIRDHGLEIAQVVRGDRVELSDGERNEVLHSQISYYANDLTVIGWNAAFVFDSPTGAESSIQLLEYANSQLLEFRHYDELLTEILDKAYKLLEQKTGFLARWRLARSARNLYTTLLDIAELTERADNAIKFLSDMFAARLYRLAAAKVGVPDYKELVSRKVRTADDLYNYMVDQFNQSRAFFLEFTVVLILLIELFFLFRGKTL